MLYTYSRRGVRKATSRAWFSRRFCDIINDIRTKYTMNKTLIALTCASMAVATAADDWSLTTITTSESGTTLGTRDFTDKYGFQFYLGDTGRMDLTYQGQEVTPLPAKLTLKSITLAANNASSASALKAVITDRDYWEDPKPYAVLGISDSFSKVADEDTTITFGKGVALSTDTTYSVYFVAIDTEVGTTFNPSSATQLSMKAIKLDGAASNDVYCGLLNNSGGGNDSAYGPDMTIQLAPEPATATLSLLALAGLASRRRRH